MKYFKWTIAMGAVALAACSSADGLPPSEGAPEKGNEAPSLLDNPDVQITAEGDVMYQDMILGKYDELFGKAEKNGGKLRPNSTSYYDLTRNINPTFVQSWTHGVVSVKWAADANPSSSAGFNFQLAALEWMSKTPIKILFQNSPTGTFTVQTKPKDPTKPNDPPNCNSGLGMNNGTINVGDCDYIGALHEIGHMIGFIHEHQRRDRNDFLIVNFCNSNTGEPSACAIDTNSVTQGPYDYSSIMQYGAGQNSSGTWSMTTPAGVPIVRPTEVSEYDAIGTSLIYAGEYERTMATVVRNGKTDIFVHGVGGSVWWATQGGDAPTFFTNLGSPNNLPIVGAPAAVSWGPNRMDVFVRGLNRDLWKKTFNGSWGNWQQIFTGVASSDPAAITWAQNRLDVLFRGGLGSNPANVMHLFSADGGSTWTPENLGGAAKGIPQIVARAPGLADVVVVGWDNQLYHRAFNLSSNTWTPALNQNWDALGGDVLGLPSLVSPTLNGYDIFIQGGRDRALYRKSWRAGGTQGVWTPPGQVWTRLGGIMNGNPTAVSWTTGTQPAPAGEQIEVFFQNSLHLVEHLNPANGGSFPLSPLAGGLKFQGSPGVTTYGPGIFNVYARNIDPRMYFKRFRNNVWAPNETQNFVPLDNPNSPLNVSW